MLRTITIVGLVVCCSPAFTQGGIANEGPCIADPIACGDTISGSTAQALPDTVISCGTSISAPGIWYTFSGIDAFLALSTCAGASYDTKLNVYEGACDSLSCVTGNDDDPDCALLSTVEFLAASGSTYFILVQGYNGAVGSFDLTMDCVTCAPLDQVQVIPTDTSAIVDWTSLNDSANFIIEVGPPGFTPGTGTLYGGSSPQDGPPFSIGGLDPGTLYDLYVVEDCGGGDLSAQTGPIDFMTVDTTGSMNDLCSDALAINCGDALMGSTANASLDLGPACGSANITAPGVWYSLLGTGQEVTLSTCGAANYDSKISVFLNDCNNLQCVVGNDDAIGCAGNTSEVTFLANTGVEYLVLVHGYASNVGDFTLSMSCSAPCTPLPINDACVDAFPLSLSAFGNCLMDEGVNFCASVPPDPNPPCDPFANIQDVWFKFNSGVNDSVVIFLNEITATSLSAAVYENCSTTGYLICHNDSATTMPLPGLTPNTDYLIRIWNGGGAEEGAFELCVTGDLTTSITEVQYPDDLTAWPVPANDVLQVSGLNQGDRFAEVFNVQGRLLLMQQFGPNDQMITLSMGNLPKGMYQLRISGKEGARAIRFIRD